MASNRTIAGKTVLVTGANRGLGAAIVPVLLERGAAKVYCGARNSGGARERSRRRRTADGGPPTDVTSAADIEAAARDLTELDVLISNAGVTYMTPFPETTMDGARRVMETNFFGPLQLMYAFADRLSKRQGGFISILSLAGLVVAPGAEVYSASKAGGMMIGYGLQGAFPGLGVSLVYPGLMDTDMMRSAPIEKTSPTEIANRSLDGVEAGQLSVFPDLHAELARDAVINDAAEMLRDPKKIMGEITGRYLAARAAARG